MKIIDYGLVCRNQIIYFTRDINDLINIGYQPYGDPYSHYVDDLMWHYQAMVKYECEVR